MWPDRAARPRSSLDDVPHRTPKALCKSHPQLSLNTQSLDGRGYSSIKFQPRSPQPHLSLPLRLTDQLGGKPYARREMRISIYLQDDVADDIVHGRGRGEELGEGLSHGGAHYEEGL